MYDARWAREIAAEFHQGHAKGRAVVARLYHLPPEYPERLLMMNQERWQGYKALCKHLERFMEVYENSYRLSRDFGSNYYTFDKYLRRVLKRRAFPASLDLLDTEIREVYSSEARNEGEARSEVTPFGLQFLFDFAGVENVHTI